MATLTAIASSPHETYFLQKALAASDNAAAIRGFDAPRSLADIERETAELNRQAAELDVKAARLLVRQAENACRPSVMLPVDVQSHAQSFNRNDVRWCASYGDVSGWGDTPDEACANFDKVWQGLADAGV